MNGANNWTGKRQGRAKSRRVKRLPGPTCETASVTALTLRNKRHNHSYVRVQSPRSVDAVILYTCTVNNEPKRTYLERLVFSQILVRKFTQCCIVAKKILKTTSDILTLIDYPILW